MSESLVQRFNQRGLAALSISAGRGSKSTYTSTDLQQILDLLCSTPNREQDQSATWSLKLLQRTLRRRLPRIGASTIRRVLHQAGYAFGRSRTRVVVPVRLSGYAKPVSSPSTIQRHRRNSA